MFGFLKILLMVISVGSAFCLIAIIMMQQSKAGGGIGAISGGAAESMFGTSATNVLLKTTTWLAIIFLCSTLLLGVIMGRAKTNTSVVEQLAIPAAATPVEAPVAVPAEPPADAAK